MSQTDSIQRTTAKDDAIEETQSTPRRPSLAERRSGCLDNLARQHQRGVDESVAIAKALEGNRKFRAGEKKRLSTVRLEMRDQVRDLLPRITLDRHRKDQKNDIIRTHKPLNV